MERLRRIADCGLRIADFKATNPKSEIRNPKSIAGIGAFCSLLTFLMVLSMPVMVMACPLCKEALFDPGQLQHRRATASGYALSIGLLLGVPVGLVGGIAMRIVQARRRQRGSR